MHVDDKRIFQPLQRTGALTWRRQSDGHVFFLDLEVSEVKIGKPVMQEAGAHGEQVSSRWPALLAYMHSTSALTCTSLAPSRLGWEEL